MEDPINETESIIYPKVILDRLTLQDESQTLDQVFIQWDGKSIEEANWENLIDLEDKAFLEDGGDDTTINSVCTPQEQGHHLKQDVIPWSDSHVSETEELILSGCPPSSRLQRLSTVNRNIEVIIKLNKNLVTT